MKIKKGKFLKKTLNFFKLNFGFFEPFHLIIDGNFLHKLLEKKLDLRSKLEKLLKCVIFLQATNCGVAELSVLGEEFRGVYLQARKLHRINCHLNEHKSPKECILELIGEKNEAKYMVATQDEELRKALREVPGVNFVFFLRILVFYEEFLFFTKKIHGFFMKKIH